jgi:hypothetical protein
MTALARCLAEQRIAAEYLREHPDGDEAGLARLGASDWVMEEILLRDEEQS